MWKLHTLDNKVGFIYGWILTKLWKQLRLENVEITPESRYKLFSQNIFYWVVGLKLWNLLQQGWIGLPCCALLQSQTHSAALQTAVVYIKVVCTTILCTTVVCTAAVCTLNLIYCTLQSVHSTERACLCTAAVFIVHWMRCIIHTAAFTH